MAKAKQDIVQRNHLGQNQVAVPKGSEIPGDLKVKDNVAQPVQVVADDDLDGLTREQLDPIAVQLGVYDAPDLGSKDDVVKAIRAAQRA